MYRVGLDILEKAMESGSPLWPYLSKNIKGGYQPDFLLNNWGIHHLHLGASRKSDGFVERTNELLYCRIEEPWLPWVAELGIVTTVLHFMEDEASHFNIQLPQPLGDNKLLKVYFIRIDNHGEWYQKEFLEILHENWPEAIKMHRMSGVSVGTISEGEIEKMFKGRTNPLMNVNGTTYAPMGGGTNKDGTTSLDILFAYGLELAQESTNKRELADGLANEVEVKGSESKTWFLTFLEGIKKEDLGRAGMLLAAGVDPNACNNHGSTALLAAALYGNVKAAELLLNAGADPNKRNQEGMTPLHAAALEGHISVLTALFAAGANPNVQNNDGWTPLHIGVVHASSEGNTSVITALLEMGAETELQNHRGRTPLYAASDLGVTEAVALLLRVGANPGVKDILGNNPVDIANKRGHTDVVATLRADGISN